MDDLFTLPSKAFNKRLLKGWDESQHPRDAKGRWTEGGGAGSTGRFTTTGAGLSLPTSARGLLNALRAQADPVKFKPSSEGEGWRVKDGPWRVVNLRQAGYEPGAETSHLLYVLRTRDLVRPNQSGSVLVRMVDQTDWWDP